MYSMWPPLLRYDTCDPNIYPTLPYDPQIEKTVNYFTSRPKVDCALLKLKLNIEIPHNFNCWNIDRKF